MLWAIPLGEDHLLLTASCQHQLLPWADPQHGKGPTALLPLLERCPLLRDMCQTGAGNGTGQLRASWG